MKTKPYPKYKPSGVEWLGNVPEHWGVKRLKNAFFVFSGSTPESTKAEYWDGDIIWYTPEDLGSNGKKFISDSRRKITDEGYSSIGAQITPPGSIIISTRAPIGHVAISSKFSCTNQGCRSLVPSRNHISDYFYYFLLISKDLLNSIGKGTTFIELGTQGLSAYTILVPPLPEQRVIADFLDRETGRIDALIEKKERLLELLAEQRAALISRAVTRGLDPSVKLKSSGVEWLGEVPEHWEVKAIKWETPVLRGASPRPIDDPVYFDEEGAYAWVRIADVTASTVYLNETAQKLSEVGSSLSVRLNPGSLFLSIAGTVGMPCIANIKCCIHDGFVYFPRLNCCVKYMYYIFACGEPYKGLGKLGTQLNLNTDTVGSILIGFPPLPEQHAIADFLDRETSKIDALSGKVKEAIDKLREYRSALIGAAVTGKIDVREAYEFV